MVIKMIDIEQIQWLIDNPKIPNPSEWAMKCEDALESFEDKTLFNEALTYIDQIQSTNAAFPQHVDMVVAILKKALRLMGSSASSSSVSSIDAPTENFITSTHKEFFERFTLNKELESLYNSIDNTKLQEIFETSHYELNRLFRLMNNRLPTYAETAYYWAESSRELIYLIEKIIESPRMTQL